MSYPNFILKLNFVRYISPGHDIKLLGVDGTPSALVGIYLGEGSLWYKNRGGWGP